MTNPRPQEVDRGFVLRETPERTNSPMSTREDSTVELLRGHLGAEYAEAEHAAIKEGPGPVRLSTALAELASAGGTLTSPTPGLVSAKATGLSEGAVQCLRFWRPVLSMWYWSSPSAILECTACGEVRLVGERKTRKCSPGKKRKTWAYDPDLGFLETEPPHCTGDLVPIEPPAKRPRRRTVKIVSTPENVEEPT